MSEKTEEPTPKKLQDARKKGDVAFSRDASSALTYLAAISLIFLTAGAIGAGFREIWQETIDLIRQEAYGPEVWGGALRRTITLTFRMLAPVVFPVALLGLLVGFAQVGVVLSGHSMKPDLKKLNPMNQLKGIFSVKGLFEFAKSLLKLLVVFGLGFMVIRGSLGLLLAMGYLPPPVLLSEGAGVARHFLWTVGIVFVGLAGLDFFFQRKQWKKKLMMSKDEVKREYKESEGDPHIKQERKQIHHEIINQDVEQAMSTADAVVVNPTHLAVAVEYKKGRMAAPKVTAKGQELLAKRIVKLAKRREVPILRDRRLARALFEVDVDSHVPRELYEAVAEVLMFAWKLKRERGA
jgi:type III secretion YscU/HrpY family protein